MAALASFPRQQTPWSTSITRTLSTSFERIGGMSITNKAATPSTIVFAASQDWDGNDGPWSSFAIQLGNPPQVLKVFPSTSGYQTLVVLPEGCIESEPPNCSDLRGGNFHTNGSSTWSRNTANISTDIYNLGIGSQFGYDSKAKFGFDDVTLGWQGAGGPSLKNQTIGGFAAKDSYLGLFVLAPRPTNFTSFETPIPSYMQNLRTSSSIPSTSWSYTAGNQYRLNGVLGSLVFGGYDRSKFLANNVTWSFNSQDISDLTVQINSITTSSGTGITPVQLLPEPIPAFLDSSLPYIWLPEAACILFERAFNLTWNSSSQLYLLDASQHEALMLQNPSVVFSLGNLTAGMDVNITFPYTAFNLTAKSPLVGTPTKYFPLKRATNSTQYTLGRTFFQEAYVIADHERSGFSVSQCDWTPGMKQDIVTILPPTPANGASSPKSGGTDPGDSHGSQIPTRAIAGGAIGGVAFVAAFLVFYFYIWPRRRPKQPASKAAETPTEYKAELHHDETKAISDMKETVEILERAELHGKHLELYEMLAVEDVAEADGKQMMNHEMSNPGEIATEMETIGNVVEMETNGNAAEMETSGNAAEMKTNGNAAELEIPYTKYASSEREN
ncbi:hypothetical protein IFR05_008304 [Cadophora sp. M221]|nr:hypothetical protein IFR05_008304 [Cadophora sp. M221]